VCNGTGACTHPNNTKSCDDGIFCNGADKCSAGTCVHPGDPCAGGAVCADTCNETVDNCLDTAGTSCDDGAFCNGADTCAAGNCVHAGNPCTGGTDCANACNEAVDNCFDLKWARCTDDGDVCTDDVCDGAGACTHPNNTAPCEEGNLCTGFDTCASGVCIVGGVTDCDDGDLCTADTCDAATGCRHVAQLLPESACAVASKIMLAIKNNDDPARNLLKWRWVAGEPFSRSDLGMPGQDTAYALCVYDTTASAPTLVASVDITPGPRWAEDVSKGWVYADRAGMSDGVLEVLLKTGDAGKTKALLKSGGVKLPIPLPATDSRYFNQAPSVIAQLVNSEGVCLTSKFTLVDTLRNDATQFKAKRP